MSDHKNLFKKEKCPNCGNQYDLALGHCPKCGKGDIDAKVQRSWANCTPMGSGGELSLFLFGWAGYSFIQIIVEEIVILVLRNYYSSQDMSNVAINGNITDFLNTGTGLSYIIFPSYILLFVGMLLIFGSHIYDVFGRFKKGVTYLGIPLGILAIIINIVYSLIISPFTSGSTNANQSNINLIIAANPVLSIVILGFVGPFCEEATYRLGLFNLAKRWNVYAAYIISAIVFGLIHFDWTNAASSIEWLNLPIYVIMGLLFAFTYDRFGFGASFLAHATNNLISVSSYLFVKAVIMK